MGSLVANPGLANLPAARSSEVRIFAGRYRVVRTLKLGNGVETLLAVDDEQDQEVVIKAASDKFLSVGAQMRLEHEAGVLRHLRSPGFAPLLHLGRENNLYLVMGFVPGITLAQRMTQGRLSVRDTVNLGRALVSALQEVHDHGVLHRDVKPANVIVNEAGPIQRTTIIDFGLARSARLDASIRDQPVGTARYMSPEQAGLLGHDTDERSDLYSTGIVLFECLAGRPPFQGDTVGEVLRQHMTQKPAELRGLGLAVPRALDEVIQRLLRKDPRDRYQSAAGVLADLQQIGDALERGIHDPPLVVGLGDRRKSLTEPAFVGRRAELETLDLQMQAARNGDGGLVLLEAESGGGKTRLLAELAQRASRLGAWVLRGQGLDQGAQRPFQVLVGVAAELIAATRAEPTLASDIRKRLGDQREAACAALPELAETLEARTTDVLGPESFGQVRSIQALTALLDSLGSPERPALVVLDDCQWADELTLKLLAEWQRRAAGRHVLVIVAFRSEEVDQAHLLRSLPGVPHLTLPPFTAADVRRLSESMAGPLPEEALALIERFSNGSPFMAAAALQGLVESGALVAEPTGWRVEPLAMADVQSSRHAAAFLVRRIEALPGDVLTLLSAGANLGKEFDLELAANLAKMTPGRAIAAIDEARRRHIIWAKTGDAQCAFIHDKLRQTLLERLPVAEREELNGRVAVHLERQDPQRVFELAYHFDAAGLSDRALPYALAAAEKARAQHSLEVAEQQYRIAERGVAPTDDATRAIIAEGLGDVFMLRGRYEQAARQFEIVFPLAQGGVAQAKIEGKLGELAFKRGNLGEAGERIERALTLLGRKVPRWHVTFFLLALWEVFVQILHTLLPKLFVGRRGRVETRPPRAEETRHRDTEENLAIQTSSLGSRSDSLFTRLLSYLSPLAPRPSPLLSELLAIRLYSRLAHLYWFHRGTIPSLWAHLRELNLAERYPMTPELAQAYSEHAPAMSLIPFFRRGIVYAEKSLAIRQQLGDLWGQGQSLHFHGIILYASSRYKECIKKCREAIRLLERTGDHWEVNIARYQIAASLYRLGDLGGAVAEAQRMHQSGVDLGDVQASGISLDVWARASLGRLDGDIVQAELVRHSHDVQRTAQVLAAKGVRLLYQGCPGEATKVFADAQDHVQRAGIRNAWVAPLLPWLATALRYQIQKIQRFTPGQRQDLLRQALIVARRAVRLARSFRNDLPHALRELGVLQAMAGDERRSRRSFDESLRVAEQQGAIYEHAQTLLLRGDVGRELGWADADDDLASAKQVLPTLEAAVGGKNDPLHRTPPSSPTLSLADRFENLLEVGRRIATALSRDAIFAAVREAAVTLLHGERCLVMKIDSTAQGENVTTVSSTELAPEKYSQSMVNRALTLGRTVAFVEGVTDNSSESVLLSGIRSALCAPIFVRGRAMGCFYVTHRQVADLFAEEEERLADFIATLAGAALENADGFAELHRLNQTLEHQIAESQRAEKRIQEQAALLDKARDAISVQDLDDRLLFWNQSAQSLYGWSAADVLGKKACELLYPRPAYAVAGEGKPSIQLEAAFKTVLERGEWTGELRQVTRAGKEIIVESRWSLVRDDLGQPKAKLVVSTDVTEKKKLEAQFLRAQRMESIGTLAGGIAHDINNVLTPILMGVDILKMNLPEERRLALLNDLKTSACRGAEMVKQVLSFARGVEGQRVLLQIRHVVRDIEKMLSHTLPKSIEIRTDFARNLLAISGDATQLYQMVMNLCVNARDAMPRGGTLYIRLANDVLGFDDVRIHPDAQAGPYVVLTIEDTGTGISPDILDKIFDPFFTTKEYGKGTGLGLSTVLGIVKGHGGFINVSSTVGTGTQFVVYLPAVESSQSGVSEEQQSTIRPGNGELVLVVDDESSIRQVTQKNLEAHGYRVLTAENGTEAVATYAQHGDKIQLVLTDMMMPGMDGLSAAQILRGLNANVKIIGFSGLASSRDSAELAGVRFDRFLLKPLPAGELLSAVREVLQEQAPG